MKFFADTASLSEIDYCFTREVNDGITTNPKIMELTGDLSKGFEGVCKELVDRYPSVPISLETDLRGIEIKDISSRVRDVKDTLLSQAYPLSNLGKNVVVKIPICEGGLEAATELESKGIKTNVTACMTPYQALAASKAGASYVSLFANRMFDTKILELAGYDSKIILTDPKWKEILKQNSSLVEDAWAVVLGQISYVAQAFEPKKSELIVGSIRSPKDIEMLVRTKPQIITIPHKIVQGLENPSELKKSERTIAPNAFDFGNSISHPMTSYTLEEFERAADLYRK